MLEGYDGTLYRAATLLLEAIQGGAKSASEKRFLYKAIEALGQAEIESLEALYQLKAEEMRDRFNNPLNNPQEEN